MKNIDDLYAYLDAEDVTVLSYDFSRFKSLSVVDDSGGVSIGIDSMQLSSAADELCTLAHEAGHCETGSFYNCYSRFDLRAKHERRADAWAFRYLCPANEIADELKNGNREIWQLADRFSVTECFMRQALRYYELL